MEHKLLVAMDDSKSAMRAAEYVAKLFNPNSKVTLFSVILETTQCDRTNPELHPYFTPLHDTTCVLAEEKIKVVSEAMQQAKKVFMGAGYIEDAIDIKVVNKEKGIARDIVLEAQSGGYDTLVMGRKGLSAIKEFVLGSVSQQVVHAISGVTVILVD